MLLTAALALVSAAMLAGTRRRGDGNGAAVHRLVRYLAPSGPPPETRPPAWARLDRVVLRWPAVALLERRAGQAGVKAPVSALLLATVAAAAAVGATAGLLRGPAAGLPAAAAIVLVAGVALDAARGRRIRTVEAQLPAAIDLLVGQLRSHRSIGEAFGDVAQWIAEPLRTECGRVAEELRIGVPLARALERLRDRVPAPAVPGIATAIAVADRTGGNLVECLVRQAESARAQIAFRHEVRALTAHARTTGTALALLPAGVAAAVLLFDPNVFAPMLGTPAGHVLLGLAAAMEVCGWQAVRAMIRRVEG